MVGSETAGSIRGVVTLFWAFLDGWEGTTSANRVRLEFLCVQFWWKILRVSQIFSGLFGRENN